MRAGRIRVPGGIAIGAALALSAAVLTPTAVIAAPTPDAGPVAGGTTVADDTIDIPFSFVDVAAGEGHTVAIGSDGATYAWGDNAQGQLGTGNQTSADIPVLVKTPAGVTFTEVDAGLDFTLALSSDGVIYAWGNNTNWELGNGSTAMSMEPQPVTAPAGVTFTQIDAGRTVSAALASDGRIYTWGKVNPVYAGNTAVPTPVAAPVGVTFTQVATSGGNSLALTSTGAIYAWGLNVYGQLGNGTQVPSVFAMVPVIAPAGVTFTQVSAGLENSFAVTTAGDVYAWGWGTLGQMGDNTSATNNLALRRVSTPAGTAFTEVTAGLYGSILALGSDGYYGWGVGDLGQLGDGAAGGVRLTPVPVDTPEGVTLSDVAIGQNHMVAIGSDGRAYLAGSDATGQLGTGAGQSNSLIPVPVGPEIKVRSVTFGGVPGTNLAQTGDQWSVSTPPLCGTVDVVVNYDQVIGAVRYPGQTTTTDGFTFGTPVTITTHPTPTDLEPGANTVRLTAEAEGDGAPTVQWQQAPAGTDAWTDIPGATTTTLDTTAPDDTSYRAVFSNCWNSAATEAALVTVTPAPEPPPVTPAPETTPPATPPVTTVAPPETVVIEAGRTAPVLATTGTTGLLPMSALALLVIGAGLALVHGIRQHRAAASRRPH